MTEAEMIQCAIEEGFAAAAVVDTERIIFVKKLADACGMEYDCGEGLLGLFGMYAFD